MTFILTYVVKVSVVYTKKFKLFDSECWFKSCEALKFHIALETFDFIFVYSDCSL